MRDMENCLLIRKRLKLVVLFLAFINANGQQPAIRSKIVDASTKRPIGFATVTNTKSLKAVDANESGAFEIHANSDDTIHFSCIGYRSAATPARLISTSDSILLYPDYKELPPVVAGQMKIEQFGNLDEKQTRSHLGSPQERYELAILIDVGQVRKYQVKKIFIKQLNFNPASPYRLHIYSVDEQGLPGVELLNRETIANESQNKDGLTVFDISEQAIVLENTNFFIGIQWLSFAEGEKGKKHESGIAETNRVAKALTFRRSQKMSGNRWYIEYEGLNLYYPKTKNQLPVGNIPAKRNPINILASALIGQIG